MDSDEVLEGSVDDIPSPTQNIAQEFQDLRLGGRGRGFVPVQQVPNAAADNENQRIDNENHGDDPGIPAPVPDAVAETNLYHQSGRGFSPGNVQPQIPNEFDFIVDEVRISPEGRGTVFIPASVLDAHDEIARARRLEARGGRGGRRGGRGLASVEDGAAVGQDRNDISISASRPNETIPNLVRIQRTYEGADDNGIPPPDPDLGDRGLDPGQEEGEVKTNDQIYRDALQPHFEVLREIEHMRHEDNRGFHQGRQIGLDYRDPAEFPVPDMPEYDGLHEFFVVPDPEEPAVVTDARTDPEVIEEIERPGFRPGRLQVGFDMPQYDVPMQNFFHPDSEIRPIWEPAVPHGEFEVWESPWPQRREGEEYEVQILRIDHDEEEQIPENILLPENIDDLPDEFEQLAVYPDRQYVDFDVEPFVNNDRPFNMSRDTELLWGPHIPAGVPTFHSFQEREDWITEMQLGELAETRDQYARQIYTEMQVRESNLPPVTDEEQEIIDRDWAALNNQLYYESSTESALSDPNYESPRNSSSWSLNHGPDPPGELFPLRTFEPYDRPVRPAEWTVSGRNRWRDLGDDLQFLVMIGEIDPDFEVYRGNIWIIHPAHFGRGRQFPTGFIHVVQSEVDFPRFGVMHGDLILKLGTFVDATAEFEARPTARLLWVPLAAATAHIFVDLTTRTHVEPDRYGTIPGKFIGRLFSFHADDTQEALTVNDLAPSSTVREQVVGTICTALFRIQRGDLIILPQAWEDNFSHQLNFRRSMIKWYKGPESDEFVTDGVMVLRFCVDREIRSDGYRRITQFDDPRRLLPLTYPTDPNFNWGFVELFMRNGTDWLFWGRDKLHPSPPLSMRTGRCLYYCSNS